MRVFYGWRIAAAGAGLQFLYSALLLQAFGAYVAVLSEELGWSKTVLAGGAAIQSLEGALLGPPLGFLIDRFGPRVMVRGGVLALAAGFFLLARIELISGFYVAMAMIAVGASLCGYFPISVALVHFFKKRRARALSLMTLGTEFTAPQALRTQAFWLLGIAHGLALLVVTAVNVHAISHIKEGLGYSLAQASFVITLMTLAQAGGILLGAAVGDRWEKRHVAAACMVAHMVGLLLLTFASHPLMLGAFALVHGMAWGLRGPFMQALRADYFGLKSIGMIMGLSAVIIAVGQVAGPLVAGVMADLTGSYRNGFMLLALLAGSGSVMFMITRKPVLGPGR